MSKRAYYFIITLLVMVNIGLAVWYFTTKVSMEQDLPHAADINISKSAEAADAFELLSDTVKFVSLRPAIAGNMSSYYTCFKRAIVRNPISVKGGSQITELINAISTQLFGESYNSLAEGMKVALAKPRFSSTHQVEYKRFDGDLVYHQQYGTIESYRAFPVMTSEYVLVIKTVHDIESGGKTHSDVGFVNYNRQLGRVLETNDIIDQRCTNQVISILNEHIEDISSSQQYALRHTQRIAPGSIQVKPRGLVFHFAEGQIAPVERGIITVFITYNDLSHVLTAEFKELAKENSGFWERYKEPKF